MLYQKMAEYSRSPVVQARNLGGLLLWSARWLDQEIPEKPDNDWIRMRMLAERIPQTPEPYAQRVGPYMLQVENIRINLSAHLDPDLDEDMTRAVEDEIDHALDLVLQRLAAFDITQPMVNQWCIDHGKRKG